MLIICFDRLFHRVRHLFHGLLDQILLLEAFVLELAPELVEFGFNLLGLVAQLLVVLVGYFL